MPVLILLFVGCAESLFAHELVYCDGFDRVIIGGERPIEVFGGTIQEPTADVDVDAARREREDDTCVIRVPAGTAYGAPDSDPNRLHISDPGTVELLGAHHKLGEVAISHDAGARLRMMGTDAAVTGSGTLRLWRDGASARPDDLVDPDGLNDEATVAWLRGAVPDQPVLVAACEECATQIETDRFTVGVVRGGIARVCSVHGGLLLLDGAYVSLDMHIAADGQPPLRAPWVITGRGAVGLPPGEPFEDGYPVFLGPGGAGVQIVYAGAELRPCDLPGGDAPSWEPSDIEPPGDPPDVGD